MALSIAAPYVYFCPMAKVEPKEDFERMRSAPEIGR
jgi:hypothetical protein